MFDLDYPGLQQVKRSIDAGKYDVAAAELLSYFREKHSVKESDLGGAEKAADVRLTPDKATVEIAENALRHCFKPHKGYGFFDYGRDINWLLWPVRDNEVLWHLHRVDWWLAMARVYRVTRDERYAREWMLQFADWAKKNPLGLSRDNDRVAWRPLEVSARVQLLVPVFEIFVASPNFTPAFLLEFLKSYHQQVNYLHSRYPGSGNHRLFASQRAFFAGASFPEFRNAPAWRQKGIEVLNAEIKKQVYPDGVHFELSPAYHVASLDIFLKAYQTAQKLGIEREFHDSYRNTVESMILACVNFSFPDYSQPMFGDAWRQDRSEGIDRLQSWLKAFPENEVIRYFASEGNAGNPPSYLSKGLANAGFYTFRSGWLPASTVMVLKASPPGSGDAFHSHPDNGTFELWANGRNFMPDSGAYVYAGDAEVMQLRNWYRQTSVHNTLTLDGENMNVGASVTRWELENDLETLAYTNSSYPSLDHQRTVFFVDRKYFVIVDRAIGTATGKLDVHFALGEDSHPIFDKSNHRVHTTYADGNNLLVQGMSDDKIELREEEGRVSYKYREQIKRPAFAFQKSKIDSMTQAFVTVLYPYRGDKVPAIHVRENPANDFSTGNIDLSVEVGDVRRNVLAH